MKSPASNVAMLKRLISA
ncbi:DNA polymerase I, partial [Haemophilus influenzae]